MSTAFPYSRWRRLALAAVLGLAALAAVVPRVAVSAAEATTAAEQPFAEHHLALQLSDAGPEKEALVISVANNLLKFYGPDRIAIEVVTFGPGVHLLEANSPKREYIDSLVAQGVRFDICMNTIETITRQIGKAPELNPKAVPVEAGVAQILALVEKGYTLVRP